MEIKLRLGFSAACGTKTTSRAFSASSVHSLNSPSLRVTSGLGSPTSACVCQAYSSLHAFVSALPSTWSGFPFPHSGMAHTYTFIRSFIDSRMLTQCLLGAGLQEPYVEHRKSYACPSSDRCSSPSSPTPTNKTSPTTPLAWTTWLCTDRLWARWAS